MLITIGVIVGLVTITGVAHALSRHPANACNTNDFGVICIDTTGGGVFVGNVSASLLSPQKPFNSHCTMEFKVYGTLANGNPFERRQRALCSWARIQVDFPLNVDLASGPALCVAIRDTAAPTQPFNPGNACVEVAA